MLRRTTICAAILLFTIVGTPRRRRLAAPCVGPGARSERRWICHLLRDQITNLFDSARRRRLRHAIRVTGLAENAVYYFVVQAYSRTGGAERSSEEVVGTVLPTPLSIVCPVRTAESPRRERLSSSTTHRQRPVAHSRLQRPVRPPSGSRFQVGTSSIACTARDALHKVASCTSTVIVATPAPPSIVCPGGRARRVEHGASSAGYVQHSCRHGRFTAHERQLHTRARFAVCRGHAHRSSVERSTHNSERHRAAPRPWSPLRCRHHQTRLRRLERPRQRRSPPGIRHPPRARQTSADTLTASSIGDAAAEFYDVYFGKGTQPPLFATVDQTGDLLRGARAGHHVLLACRRS